MSARGLKLYSAHLVKHPHDNQPVLVTGGQLPMIGVPVDHHDRACGSERRTLEKGTSSQKVDYLCTGFASCLSDPREFGSSTSYHFADLPAFVTIFLQVSRDVDVLGYTCPLASPLWSCHRASVPSADHCRRRKQSNPVITKTDDDIRGGHPKTAHVNTRSVSQD